MAYPIKLLILFVYVYTCTIQCAFSKEITCKLHFKSSSSDQPFPESAVPVSDGHDMYVARIEESNGNWLGGRLGDNRQAWAATSTTVLKANSYEILTNPNECVIKWSPGKNANSVMFSSNTYVGRVYSREGFLSGYIDSKGEMHYVDENGYAKTTAFGIEYMTSYSPGLQVSMGEFTMEAGDSGNSIQFLGMDVINNQSPARVKQSVSHKKKIMEKTKVKPGGAPFSSSVFNQVNANVQLSFGSSGGPFISMSNSAAAGNDGYQKTTEKEIIMERGVEVEPYTSVHICSTISVAENFVATYTAVAEATGKGLSAAEVMEVLKAEGESAGWVLSNDRVTKQISGEISGSVALSSHFTVSPSDSGSGCGQIAALVKANSRLERESGSLSLNTTAKKIITENYQTLKSILNLV